MKAVLFFPVLGYGMQVRSSLNGTHPEVFMEQFLPIFEHDLNLWSLKIGMEDIYGKGICTYSSKPKDFISNPEAAPEDFCRYLNNQPEYSIDSSCHPDLFFDQFSLERIALGKWRRSSWTCNGRNDCQESADIVVVPSVNMHLLLTDGHNWKTINPEANDPTGCTGATGKIADEKARDRFHQLFWDQLRENYYKPEEGYQPLILMHMPFTWDIPNSVQVLHSLAEQPSGFVSRIVIASIESNVRREERALFPKHWSDGADLQLRNRVSVGADSSTDGPLLVTMPYPTSILYPAVFQQSTGNYKAFARPIAVSMSGDAKRGGPGIRNNMTTQLWNNRGSYGMVCTKGDQRTGPDHCGLGEDPNMWDVLVNSQFCIEPPGDTLTRSHFYLAVQSGCIPVIFDGGLGGFEDELQTWWPWRTSSQSDVQEPFFDYKDFAVIYSSSDVLSGKVDVVKELLDMPTKDPDRLWRLRQRLDAVAPTMTYSKERCELNGQCIDAFSTLQGVLQKAVSVI